ncbi:MAG: hypothetical protein CMF52_08775 [Legionellales bacterium]|nr:hypothetical protein [Legionellales bacterium]
MDKMFILVISMWGNTGTEWEYIGNQMSLQIPMTLEQCSRMADESTWATTYNNEYYIMLPQCYPADCAGKASCDPNT